MPTTESPKSYHSLPLAIMPDNQLARTIPVAWKWIKWLLYLCCRHCTTGIRTILALLMRKVMWIRCTANSSRCIYQARRLWWRKRCWRWDIGETLTRFVHSIVVHDKQTTSLPELSTAQSFREEVSSMGVNRVKASNFLKTQQKQVQFEMKDLHYDSATKSAKSQTKDQRK